MKQNQRSLRVGVLFGGRSGEHEVSLASARNIIEALGKAGHTVIPIGITRQGRWLTDKQAVLKLAGDFNTPVDEQPTLVANGSKSEDTWALLPHAGDHDSLPALDIIFPVLHGPYGEDGAVQGMLEMANIPYVGPGVLASAVGMDKAIAKQLFNQAGLRQAAHQVILRKRWQNDPAAILECVEHTLRYPLFVKPANLGSSIGVSKARNRDELIAAIGLACRYDRKVLVEEAVRNAREIEVSVMGNDDPMVSIPGEVVPGNEFYDYAAKYLDDNSELLIPAPISDALVEEAQAMALAAFQAADCAGLARVDFLLDDVTQKLYLNEINTMPGFTRISMYPKLWEASGVPYPELVNRLINLALERHDDQMQNAVTRIVSQPV
jgi:D-alanine-D-alanine ligase